MNKTSSITSLLIILAIVILPALVAALSGDAAAASPLRIAEAIGLTLAKIAVFVALMLVIGTRVFPWMIVQVAHTKSRELMSLGTLALALGVAYAAFRWFDASFALGAFLAGVMLSDSEYRHEMQADIAPSIGTTATPVIDPATNTVYVTHKVYDGAAGGTSVAWYLDALDAFTGAERPNFPVKLSGFTADNDPSLTFNARNEQQRNVIAYRDAAPCRIDHRVGAIYHA